MLTSSIKFGSFISDAFSSGAVVSLQGLFDLLELNSDDYILNNIGHVQTFLDTYHLDISPPFNQGGLTEDRIIRSCRSPMNTTAFIEEIKMGESFIIEFKSSLFFDYDKAKNAPGLNAAEYKSEGVLFSSLKTIAAFLNCGGGILYIGIKDDGSPIGIHYDCSLFGFNQVNNDQWEIQMRNCITGKFKNGSSINDYIRIHFFSFEGAVVARLNIIGRKILSFVKKDNSLKLFRRQGNRTIDVAIDEVEEFILHRQSLIL